MHTFAGGIPITTEVASVIKGMVLRGDRQSDVGAFWGINQARVAEVIKGRLFPDAPVAPDDHLPPSGPYLQAHDAWRRWAVTAEAS